MIWKRGQSEMMAICSCWLNPVSLWGNKSHLSLSFSRTNCADVTQNKFSRVAEEVSRVKQNSMAMI